MWKKIYNILNFIKSFKQEEPIKNVGENCFIDFLNLSSELENIVFIQSNKLICQCSKLKEYDFCLSILYSKQIINERLYETLKTMHKYKNFSLCAENYFIPLHMYENLKTCFDELKKGIDNYVME